MNQCAIIPERILHQRLKEYNEIHGTDWTPVWRQGDIYGVYLKDFTNNKVCEYIMTLNIVESILRNTPYHISNCIALFYTTSQFYLAIWN